MNSIEGHPAVSVIIPTYNRARYVTEAIESVLAQTFTDYEILVIDDGSTDSTKALLQPYLSKIIYIHQENRGVSAARNKGLKAAKGEWIAFLDSDDIWLPKKLEIQFEDIQHHDNIDLHICNGEYVDGHTVQNMFLLRGITDHKQSLKLINNPFVHFCKFKYACLPSVVLKKKSIYFNGSMQYLEDFEYLAKIAVNSQSWLLRTDILVKYFRRSESSALSLTQRCNDDLRFRMLAGNAVADNLEKVISLDKHQYRYMSSVKTFRSNNYFSYAIKCQNPKEARGYLLKGLLARISLKNLLKYLTYYSKTWVDKSLEHDDKL